MTENMKTFAKLVSNIVGETINPEKHIHIGSGRYYYIQSTMDGAPMLLRHYCGALFIYMSKNDYNGIISGTVDAKEYVNSANWMFGHYLAAGSMVGGYYQPIDIINYSEEVKRYIHILSCRINAVFSGYRPTEDRCANCAIKNCPFSSAECNRGNWEDESIIEKDYRYEVFNLLSKKFESQFPGYTLSGFFSSLEDGSMQSNECIIQANPRWLDNDPYSFMIWLSAETIRGILMHTISMEDAQKIVDGITFYHSNQDVKVAKGEELAKVTKESIQEIFKKPGMDHPAEEAAEKAEATRIAAERARWGIFGFIYDMLHK